MKKHIYVFILTALILGLLAGCGAPRSASPVTSIEQLGEAGRRIGVASDTAEDRLVKQAFPLAQIEYFKDELSAYTSVNQGRIDAYVYNRLTMETAINSGLKGVRLLEENLGPENAGAVAISPVTPIPDLEGKVNAFLREIRADGTLDDVMNRWLVVHDETMPDLPVPTVSETRLVVGTTGSNMPFTYYIGTELGGYDVELARRFAVWLGATLEFKVYDYDGIVAAAQAGDVDCIFANLFVTPEREEALRFSEPTFVGQVGVMVRDDGASPIPHVRHEARWQDYNGKRIGVLVGPLMEDAAAKYFPDSERLYFDRYPDCATALLTGKIDGFLGDEPGMIAMHAEAPEIDYIHEPLTENNYAFAFRKDDDRSEALCEELNAFLAKSWEDGTMEEIAEIWLGTDESKQNVDMSGLTGKNGTIRVVTTSTDMPWSYIKDGKNVGYDIDLVVRFCRDRGYALNLGDVDFAGRIPAVQSGKYDFTTDMNVTLEREEQVRFSEPTAHGGIVLAVRASDLAAPSSAETIFERIADSFQKTFLRENRWKLFLHGIGTTMLITVLSIVLGTALGFGLYLLCRKGSPAANALTRFFVWLVQGMPMVVLLMILYYVIFGKAAVSGTVVSILGFTLVFGAGVFGMLKSGVGAVDAGQAEAAYALGYTDRRAFFRVVLPQALPHFMPAYRGEITATVKATAIVGYVAVQDLTKMGDIIRSRTYEAFFPLIAVAVIYFLLAALLTFLVNRVELRIDPRRRGAESILKGVRTE